MIQHSESIKALAAALLRAQAKYRKLRRNRVNPHFKSRYADLDNCFDATKAALAAEGLVVIQGMDANEKGDTVVSTLIVHVESGEYVQDHATAAGKDRQAQTVGAIATYLRRYGYSAMVGITPDPDLDGEDAMPRQGTAQTIGQRTPSSGPRPVPQQGPQQQRPPQQNLPGTAPVRPQ